MFIRNVISILLDNASKNSSTTMVLYIFSTFLLAVILINPMNLYFLRPQSLIVIEFHVAYPANLSSQIDILCCCFVIFSNLGILLFLVVVILDLRLILPSFLLLFCLVVLPPRLLLNHSSLLPTRSGNHMLPNRSF